MTDALPEPEPPEAMPASEGEEEEGALEAMLAVHCRWGHPVGPLALLTALHAHASEASLALHLYDEASHSGGVLC